MGLTPAPFRPRPPWFGPDLQTLRNRLRGPAARPEGHPAERFEIALGGGDLLVGAVQRPNCAAPLAVLVHGLTGCADSAYMLATAAQLLAAGWAVARLNLRGAGSSRTLCRFRYHAGRTEDLARAFAFLSAGAPIAAVGFSLGGNLLLKYLAEQGADGPVAAAAAVSTPLDLRAASMRLMAPRNFAYHRYLLGRMRRDRLTAPGIDGATVRAVQSAGSVYDYDDRVVARENGFAGAEDYYSRCSALRFLPEIATPTLLVHSLDDPWIPAASYRNVDWPAMRILSPLLTEGGGHVGFHEAGHRAALHDRAIAAFFAARLGTRYAPLSAFATSGAK